MDITSWRYLFVAKNDLYTVFTSQYSAENPKQEINNRLSVYDLNSLGPRSYFVAWRHFFRTLSWNNVLYKKESDDLNGLRVKCLSLFSKALSWYSNINFIIRIPFSKCAWQWCQKGNFLCLSMPLFPKPFFSKYWLCVCYFPNGENESKIFDIIYIGQK